MAQKKTVETKLQSTQKGFHPIEYFLFGEDNNRQANELSQRELELLTWEMN
jgi:hypothetical protein